MDTKNNNMIMGIIFISIFILVFLYSGIKNRKEYLAKKSTHEIIRQFKNNLSFDDLTKMNFKFEKDWKSIQNIKKDMFYEALHEAQIGGTSHPVVFNKLLFSQNPSEEFFVITVYFARVGDDRNIVYSTIELFKDGVCIDGIPYISPEMTVWGEEIGIFD